jgi:hypothetical protein
MGKWQCCVLELLEEFPIISNKSQRFIHAWWVATLSTTLLVEVEESLLIR